LCEECLQKDIDQKVRIDCVIELVEALNLQAKFDQAEHILRETLKSAEKDDFAKLYFSLGSVLRAASRSVEARNVFSKARDEIQSLQTSPDMNLLRQIEWALGGIYYELGEYEHAIEAYRSLLSFYQDDTVYRRNALLLLGQSYQRKDERGAAQNCYNAIVMSGSASEQEKAHAQQGLGNIYYDSGEYDKAIVCFKQVFACFPETAPVYSTSLLWLGYCYQGKNDYESARYYYHKVIASASATDEEKASAEEFLAEIPADPGNKLQ
jgi:tetratricopeptide (TPR) repeat protein